MKLPQVFLTFSGGSDSKESARNVGDLGSIPGLGRSPGGGHGNSLQYSCLENPHGQRSLATSSYQMGGRNRQGEIRDVKLRCRAQARGMWASVVAAHGVTQMVAHRLYSVSSVAVAHVKSSWTRD